MFTIRPDLCLACGADVPSGIGGGPSRPPRCPLCHAPLFCPRGRDFPDAVKSLVLTRHLEQYFAPQHGPDAGWPQMLASVFRGSIVETVSVTGVRTRHVIRHADGPDTLYPAALVAAGLHTPYQAPRDTTAAAPPHLTARPSAA